MSKTYIIYLKLLFCVIVWGSSFVATKIVLNTPDIHVNQIGTNSVSLQEISPATVVWTRFLIGVIILGCTVFFRREMAFPGWKELGYFALLGFIGISFHQWLQSTGLVTAQATTTGWIVASMPIFLAILGWFFLKEKVGWFRVSGIALATVGVLLVVTKGNLSSLIDGHFGSPGDVLILISAPNWAIFSALSRSGLKRHPAALMMLYVMGFGWLFSSVPFFAGPGLHDLTRLSINGWLGIGFLGILSSGVAYIFWYDALKNIPASRAGAFLYLEPLATVAVAALILHEPLILASLLGGAIILVGVWMVNRPDKADVMSPEM
jgi:drug/metabolite transporter (DMT)-like permease